MKKTGRVVAALGGFAVATALGCMAYVTMLPKPVMNSQQRESNGRQLVVVVHGMGRTSLSMTSMAWTLERQGYEVLNWGYSSMSHSIGDLAQLLGDELEGKVDDFDAVHFVGHSLGNIIVRKLLEDRGKSIPPGRIVMLAPPNQGSHAADKHHAYAGSILTPIKELRTDPESTVRKLGPVKGREVAIIVGRYDSKVYVEEARLEGARVFHVIGAAHTFLMNRPDVHRWTIEFLASGCLDSIQEEVEPEEEPIVHVVPR